MTSKIVGAAYNQEMNTNRRLAEQTLEPVCLVGECVVLEPLTHAHHDGLVEAVRDGELWKLWYTSVPTPEQMEAEIDRRLRLQDSRMMVPFTIRLKDQTSGRAGSVVGMTTFMNIDEQLPRVEIGSTWTALSAQGTGANPDSKLLLLQHAFEVWGCPAVEFRTHWHNRQSREAIARLGAKQDGVLRSHSRSVDGALRDTVVFSILSHEWPAVRLGLEARLDRHRR